MSSSIDQPYNSNNISFSRQSFGGFSVGKGAAGGNGKKAVVVCRGDKKAMAALKSHSDAERRRRERINSHLATFRRLLPFTLKMDKASLLGEVIKQVKELKQNAIEASKATQFMIPTDDGDQVKVEACKSSSDVVSSFKATLCCGFHPNLLSHVRQALEELPDVKLANVEICSAGGRLKTEFLFNAADNYSSSSSSGDAQLQEIVDSVHCAITCVLEKTFATSSVEYDLPPCSNPNKRRRLSNSCTSSSL